jgi:predicted alpha-1,2-mannosidase
MKIPHVLFSSVVLALAIGGGVVADSPPEDRDLADLVDPMIGILPQQGSCVPGACLPHASIYSSPDTLGGGTNGYSPGQDVVGFAQLHTQGTGGVPSYGNFLISPQIGLKLKEQDHTSSIDDETFKCFYYKARLTKYDILCEVVPARHSALYKFMFPASNDANILIDVARKLGSAASMSDGSVTIDPQACTITGGGTFTGNWNPAPYELHFCAKLSKQPDGFGIWEALKLKRGVLKGAVTGKKRLGAYAKFNTTEGETIYLKIAVSFKSETQAAKWLEKEIPEWDFEGLKSQAHNAWNKTLSSITMEGASQSEMRKFYTALFHAMVQPRDRTGDNGNWQSDAPFWDDHYTIWDTWKTLFPLLAIIRPDVVRDNVNSFIDRYKHNGCVASAFIQGQEYKVGQGGDDVDNVIADACLKGISGVDWNEAYELLRFHADKNRTANYRDRGYVTLNEKTDYCHRLKSGSGTLAFAYNDYCVAQVAKGLGKMADYQRYLKRSRNWENVWDATAEDSGYTGFVRARKADGVFAQTPPRKGYNTDFYEGTCWIYSYVIPHDVPGMIEKMGGQQKFIDRLCFALKNNLIDFANEPSFMTIWLFDLVKRPYLASYWANVLRNKFGDRDYPGDDDSGAMGSLYVFLTAGLFPFAGQDVYYLHGPSVPKITFHLQNGKTFTILGTNSSPSNIYIQSAKLNGKPLQVPWIRHKDVLEGGVLEFTMGPSPSPWGCDRQFDPETAAREIESGD